MPAKPKKPVTTTTPQVDYVREDVAALMPGWDIIRDVLAGQLAVKAKGSLYLAKPNADDDSPANTAHFNSRLKRAVFYNFTARTHRGYVGQVFHKDPSIDLPENMAYFEDNVDGSGVQLNQQAKLCFNWTLAFGRAGLLVDYPNQTDESGQVRPTTVADMQAGNVRPTINLYAPETIINWREKVIGSLSVLSLVVLVEDYLKEDDGFKPTFDKQWRVLRLTDENQYTVEIFRKGENGFASNGILTPTDGNGKPFDRIPFTFVGAEDNSPTPDEPPLLDLALLNLAHYNNSADNEDSIWYVGSPMFWFSGLSETWVKNVLGGKVRVGSSTAVLLPEKGSAGIVQAEANTLAFSNMEHKEKQAVAIGAKLVESKSVQRTATEAGISEVSETSTLASTAKNVTQAYRAAFSFVARFLGLTTNDDDLAYELNTDLSITRLDTQAQQAIVASWQAGLMDFEEARWNFRRGGLVYKDDEEVQESIDSELVRQASMQQALTPDDNEEEDDPDNTDDT